MSEIEKRHYECLPILISALLEIKAGGDEPWRIASDAIYQWDKERSKVSK